MAQPLRALVRSFALLGALGGVGFAHGRTRSECEAGNASIRDALARPQSLEGCLEAVEDARAALPPGGPARAERPPAEDARVQVDRGLPVSVEAAKTPDPGEVEARLLFGYDRLRRLGGVSGDGADDASTMGGRRFGRDLYVPEAEVEIGLARGLSARIATAYRFGNAEEARTGEVELALKWNLLPAQGPQPALALGGGVSVPYGPRHGSAETVLGLFASQPLSPGPNAPYLHANLFWFHALDRNAGQRSDRYAVALAFAVPVARSTGLLVGFAREQEQERGRADQFVELGVRQVLPGGFLLGAGAGFGLGDSETGFRLLVGLQKNF